MSSNTVPHSACRRWSLLVGSALLVGTTIGLLATNF